MAGDRVHLLDVGTIEYGECIVAEIADKLILVDGGHVGDQNLIEGQLKQILGQDPPFDFDLLIVSHCHSDHIGALPKLVATTRSPRLGAGVGSRLRMAGRRSRRGRGE